MKRICAFAAIAAIFVASSATVSRAGGLIQNLPKDGSWTKYHIEMKNDRQAQQNMTGTFTLRSVGTVTENGEKWRWIEFQIDGTQNGMKQRGVMKFLVQEKAMKAGAKSSPKILRGWKKDQRNGELKELAEEEKSPNGMMSMFFGGKRKDVKTIKGEKIIDYQKGQIKVASGTKGTLDVKVPEDPNFKIKYTITQSVWAHKKIPFGTAEMQTNMKVSIGDNPPMTTTMKFTLQDHGSGAKSALPDQN